MVKELFAQHLNVDLGAFPRMTWHEAMERFGSDKPDLRIDLELVSVDDLMADVEFKVFSALQMMRKDALPVCASLAAPRLAARKSTISQSTSVTTVRAVSRGSK